MAKRNAKRNVSTKTKAKSLVKRTKKAAKREGKKAKRGAKRLGKKAKKTAKRVGKKAKKFVKTDTGRATIGAGAGALLLGPIGAVAGAAIGLATRKKNNPMSVSPKASSRSSSSSNLSAAMIPTSQLVFEKSTRPPLTTLSAAPKLVRPSNAPIRCTCQLSSFTRSFQGVAILSRL